MKPISPGELYSIVHKRRMDGVIDVVNGLITEAWDGRKAVITTDNMATAVASRLKISTQELFDRLLLDIEEIYEEVGWVVNYSRIPNDKQMGWQFIFTI